MLVWVSCGIGVEDSVLVYYLLGFYVGKDVWGWLYGVFGVIWGCSGKVVDIMGR